MRYKAFISYKNDKQSTNLAVALEKALKQYAKPFLKPPLKIFRDDKEILPGDQLSQTLTAALENSEYLIYLATSAASRSFWVQKEISYWCNELHRVDRLIIVHIDDNIILDTENDAINWDKSNALPGILKNVISSIPVYIDLTWARREDGLNLENSRYRDIVNSLSARLRGKTPAQMNDEQLLVHRRNIRLRNIAASVLIAFALATYFSMWYASRQQKKAIINGIVTEAGLRIATDNTRAIRIAQAAYDMEHPHPSPAVKKALSDAAASSLSRPFYHRIMRHRDDVRTAAFSPDGKHILSISYDKNARLWNSRGDLAFHWNSKSYSVQDAIFSNDSTRIVTLSSDGAVRLWDIRGTPIASIDTHPSLIFINSIALSPDNSMILTAANDETAQLRNWKGDLLATFDKHYGPVTHAVFTPDRKHVLTGGGDGTVKLWDLRGNLLANFDNMSSVSSINFKPGGEYAIIGTVYEKAILLNLKENRRADLHRHKKVVRTALFSPGGRQILTASETGKVVLWDEYGSNILTEYFAHRHFLNSAVFSPDGRRILTASGDGTAKLWNLEANLIKDFNKHSANVTSAAFSPDGTRIVTTSQDNTVILWNLQENPAIRLDKHAADVNDAVFSPDGRRVFTISDDSFARLWDLNGNLIHNFYLGNRGISADFSPDGKRILTVTAGGEIALWNLKGKRTAHFNRTYDTVAAAFSSGGDKIDVYSRKKTVTTLDLTGNPIAGFNPHKNKKELFPAFSPDRKRILKIPKKCAAETMSFFRKATESKVQYKKTYEVNSAVYSRDRSLLLTAYGRTAKLWSTGGVCRTICMGHRGRVYSAVFSPDESQILTAGEDGTAKLWNLDGNILADFKGHTGEVRKAVFSPDGTRVLTVSDDKTAKLWDLEGHLIGDYNKHTRKINNAVFSPDGNRIVTSSEDGTAIIWMTPDTIYHWLKTSHIPPLSKEDRERLGID